MSDTPSPDAGPHGDAPVLTGGCLCGRIRYRAQPESLEGYYCHCRMCQLAVGNTRAAFLNLPVAAVVWTAGPPRWYASSRIAERGFCDHCGTPLAFHYRDSDHLDLTVGSLDEPGRLRPSSHFAVETRIAAWHVADGLPEQRFDEHQRIAERWQQAYGDAPPGLDTARSAPADPPDRASDPAAALGPGPGA